MNTTTPTTHTERLGRARGLLGEAFAELEALDLPDPLEHSALLEARADVGEALRRVGALIVFTRKSER